MDDGGVGGRNIHDGQAETLISKLVRTTSPVMHDVADWPKHRWQMPSLSLHTIENATPGAGATTSIPASLVCKFSIWTVPNVGADETDKLVQQHMKAQFKKLQSRNGLRSSMYTIVAWFSNKSTTGTTRQPSTARDHLRGWKVDHHGNNQRPLQPFFNLAIVFQLLWISN